MKQDNYELISVIVPVYNVEKYLGKCLDSICRQTYYNIEVICVDDASTDLSASICDKFTKKDCRFHVIHKEKNEGLSEARNTGVKYSKGKYISFVDSDDWIDENFLEELYSGIKEYSADIAQCGYARITNDLLKVHHELEEEKVAIYTGFQALTKIYSVSSVCASVMYSVVWNKLYRRSVLSGIDFPRGKIYEDQFFTYKCYDRAEKIYVTNKKLYSYRENNASITKQKYTIKFQDEIKAHEEQIKFFMNKNLDFASIVIARIEPLCIMHYLRSGFEDDNKAKKRAYIYMLKYSVFYLKNKNINLEKKLKLILFLFSPDIFMYMGWNINYSLSDK